MDSLCIIQAGDNSKDWQREVTLMSEVYSNSFCNISAAAAPNSAHPIFNDRNPNAISPPIVEFLVNEPDAKFLISDSSLWHKDVDFALINTRAWVIQERLLSVRNLHFTESQLFWECREKDASEIYPTGLPKELRLNKTRLKSTFNLIEQASVLGNSSSVLESWREIVRAYTACQLTVPSDKLPAISSLAKKMRALLNDQYVVGLWRRILVEEMLWWVARGQTSRPQEYRAPSVCSKFLPFLWFNPKICILPILARFDE